MNENQRTHVSLSKNQNSDCWRCLKMSTWSKMVSFKKKKQIKICLQLITKRSSNSQDIVACFNVNLARKSCLFTWRQRVTRCLNRFVCRRDSGWRHPRWCRWWWWCPPQLSSPPSRQLTRAGRAGATVSTHPEAWNWMVLWKGLTFVLIFYNLGTNLLCSFMSLIQQLQIKPFNPTIFVAPWYCIMCTHHAEGCLLYFMFSIAQHLTVLIVFLPREQGLVLGAFWHIYLPRRRFYRNRSIWHPIHQHAVVLVLVNQGQVSSLGNTAPSQWVRILSIHYVLYGSNLGG